MGRMVAAPFAARARMPDEVTNRGPTMVPCKEFHIMRDGNPPQRRRGRRARVLTLHTEMAPCLEQQPAGPGGLAGTGHKALFCSTQKPTATGARSL